MSASAEVCSEELIQAWVVDGSRHNRPLSRLRGPFHRSDTDGVVGDAVEKIHGTVDRVDDPGHPRVSFCRESLFAEEAIAWTGTGQQFSNHCFGVAVDLGHHIDNGRFGPDRMDTVTPLCRGKVSSGAGNPGRNIPQFVVARHGSHLKSRASSRSTEHSGDSRLGRSCSKIPPPSFELRV